VSPRGENIAAGLALDEILHGFVAGAEVAELWMVPRQMVEATTCTADGLVLAVA
jgi:hypothetical protein